MDEQVNVSVRIKPSFAAEHERCLQVISEESPALLIFPDRQQTFQFDNIFTDNQTQADIYNSTIKHLVEKVKTGYTCTVLAYGQTGTGKTYTIGTSAEVHSENDAGLISRALKDFFNFDNELIETEISITFIEVYNEKAFDLLDSNKVPLTVKGFTVHGSREVKVQNLAEALQLLKDGNTHRHTGETKQNACSSRSHAIFSVHCLTTDSRRATTAKLNLVDLAGSESIRKTGNRGTSLQEGININKGLLSFGQVMTALSNNASFIPYRESIITTLLQDSLNAKNYVSVIACINTNSEDLGETLQTLKFSNRVKKMKNRPETNERFLEFKENNPTLFANDWKTPFKRPNGSSYETPFKKIKTQVASSGVKSGACLSSTMIMETPQMFSPIMRKYVNEIVSRLQESIVANTQRSTSRHKGNLSPLRLSWDAKDDTSPLCTNIEDSLINNSEPSDTQTTKDDFIFKIPSARPKSDRSLRTNKPKANLNDTVRRRSVRLQAKLVPTTSAVDAVENTSKRRSVRLQLQDPNSHTRRSAVKENLEYSCVHCTATKEKTKESKTTKDSPITKRTKQVLDVLNNGNARELEQLQTVGAKTAQNIVLFRQLNGKFKSVLDIAKMPYWSQKKCDKFLAMNYLKK